jgi:flagellar motor switch protein FliM
MTNSPGDKNLTREKLRQLIAAATHCVDSEEAKVDATEYNWQEPHRFNQEQITLLESFIKRFQSGIATSLETLCQVEFEVNTSSITQQFSRNQAEKITNEMQDFYFLPFLTGEGRPSGFVGVSTATASAIVGNMLRDSNISASEDRKLSELEESILMDALGALTETISSEFERNGCPSLKKSPEFIKGQWPLGSIGFDDIINIDFEIKDANGEHQVNLTILSELAEQLLGMKSGSQTKIEGQDVYNAIMQKAHKVPVEVTAQLCSASMKLDDIMSLNAGDVLLLEHKIREPLWLLFNGRKGFKGHPAKSSGKYAVVIAPTQDE